MVEMTFDISLALAVVNAGIAALGMALAIFNMVLAVVGAEVVGRGWSWVGGVILESDRRGLRSDRSEDES